MPMWKRTLYALWIGQFLSIMGFMFIIPFMPPFIRDELGVVGEPEVARWSGIVLSAAGFSMMVFSPVWGVLADRYGRKPMILRSMYGGTVVLALMALSRDVGDLIVLRMLQGALTGTVTASIALVASIAPAKRSGYALGMMQAAVFAGASVGPLLGGWLSENIGYRLTFVVGSGLLLVAGVVVQFGVGESFVAVPASERRQRGGIVSMFVISGFLAALLVRFLVSFANTVTGPVFVLFVEKLHGQPEGARTLTGLILAAAGFAAAVSAGVFGRFGDTWGHKRLLIISTLFAGVVILPMALAETVGQLFVLRALFGFAAAGILPSVNAIIRDLIREDDIGKAFGVNTSVSCLGWALGPLAGGYMATMGLEAPFVLTGIVFIIVGILIAWLIKSRLPAAAVGQ